MGARTEPGIADSVQTGVILHCSSEWDGSLKPLTEAQTAVYMATGENDSYYGSSSVRETYEKLVKLY